MNSRANFNRLLFKLATYGKQVQQYVGLFLRISISSNLDNRLSYWTRQTEDINYVSSRQINLLPSALPEGRSINFRKA